MEAMGWSVADNLGLRANLSRLLNSHIGISPAMALSLERIGWSNAKFLAAPTSLLSISTKNAAVNRPHNDEADDVGYRTCRGFNRFRETPLGLLRL